NVDAGPMELWERTLKMLQLLHQPGFELAMAVLLHSALPTPGAGREAAAMGLAETIGRRLKFSNLEIERIGWLLGHEYDLADAPSLRASRLKRLFANEWSADLLSLARAETLARNGDMRPIAFCDEFLLSYTPEERNPPPLITGQDLISAGLKPGSRFKELLDAARDAQLDGEIESRDEALSLVRRLMNAGS
ncbi:MAG: hypothetical protein AB7O26_20130, partial [Planctomycetaceae bacterium]